MLVNNSNIPDDLPLSLCEGAFPCTSELLAFSFFRGAFLPFATIAAGFVDASQQLYCRQRPADTA